MELIQGTISGIGDEATRKNEITADGLASIRNYIVGYHNAELSAGGVIKDDSHDFDCSIDSNDNTIIHLTDGIGFAYGYFGYYPATEITIFPPAVQQYHVIYAEFDKSVIPNTFLVKTKNNQSSPNVLQGSFRKDQLSMVKTGVFQLPLWLITVTNKGIQELTDLRPLKKYIQLVEYSTNANIVASNGILEENVTAVTPPKGDISYLVATTEFVNSEIQAVIGGSAGEGGGETSPVFYIDGVEYKCNLDGEGYMPTWSDWCESSYNTGGFYVSEKKVYSADGKYYVGITESQIVLDSARIVSGGRYLTTSVSGGSGDVEGYEFPFTIDNVQYYYFTEGSGGTVTWSSWCASPYNTGGFYVENGYVYSSNGNSRVATSSSLVNSSSYITSGYAYQLVERGVFYLRASSTTTQTCLFDYDENGLAQTWEEWCNSTHNTLNADLNRFSMLVTGNLFICTQSLASITGRTRLINENEYVLSSYCLEIMSIGDTNYKIKMDTSFNTMTWEEWCNSEYNTSGFYVANGNVHSADGQYKVCYMEGTKEGVPVLSNGKIDVRTYRLVAIDDTFYIEHDDGTIDAYQFAYNNGVAPTWAEWCASEHNTAGFFVVNGGVRSADKKYKVCDMEGTNSGAAVLASDEIRPTTYRLVALNEGKFYIARSADAVDTHRFAYNNGVAPTWAEWCASNDDYVIDEQTGYVRRTAGSLVTDIEGHVIKGTDFIVDSKTYYTYVAAVDYVTTFYIDGVGYQIYIDSRGNAMSWKEWCDSEYNTAGFRVLGYVSGYEDQSIVLSADEKYQVAILGSFEHGVIGSYMIDVLWLYELIEFNRLPLAGTIEHFSVDGEQFEFMYGERGYGPTWQTWLNSSYNTSKLYPNSWFVQEGIDKDFIRKSVGDQPDQYNDYYLCENYTQNRTRGVRIAETIIAIPYFTQETIPS